MKENIATSSCSVQFLIELILIISISWFDEVNAYEIFSINYHLERDFLFILQTYRDLSEVTSTNHGATYLVEKHNFLLQGNLPYPSANFFSAGTKTSKSVPIVKQSNVTYWPDHMPFKISESALFPSYMNFRDWISVIESALCAQKRRTPRSLGMRRTC